MKFAKSVLFAATMLTAVSASAVEVSGNVAIGSDYFFRGVDQASGPAISGGFDAGFENGAYVGVWASSVGFGADDAGNVGGLELDYYVGYGGAISESVSYDLGYVYYGYPQNASAEEFEEFYGSVSYSDVTVGFATSNDWYNSTGSYTYFYADYGLALSEAYSLGFHYGTSSADDAANEYADYSVSLSTEAAGLGFDLSLISTDHDDYADNELVLTISKSL
jgi:uncharacterized protein (TIGR02001 family)